MVDPTPISEITNIQANPDNYSGGTAAVIPASKAADYIQQAATARATLNKTVSALHEQRLNDVLKDVNGLGYADVMPNDLPDINKNYAQLMQDISDNVDVIQNPSSNIQKYSEFQQKLAALKSQINTSKAHNSLYTENQKAMWLHPDLNSEDNQSLMANYATTPAAQRQSFILKTPASFNPETFQKAALASTQAVTNTEDLSPDKHYIVTTKGVKYDPDQYFDKYVNLMKTTMVNGKTAFDNFKTLYDKMPVDPTTGEKPSFDDVLKASALSGLQASTTSKEIKANPIAEEQDRLGEQDIISKRETALGYAKLALEGKLGFAKLDQDGKALKQNEIRPEEGAEAKYLAMRDVLKGSGLNAEYGQNIYGSDDAEKITFQSGGQPTRKPDGSIDPFNLTPVVKQEVPAVQFVSAVPDPATGGVVVTVNHNSMDPKTGRVVSKPVTTHQSYDQMKSEFNRIYGNKFTTQIASGSSTFNKKRLGVTDPTLQDLDTYFTKGQPAATPTPAVVAPVVPVDASDPLGIRKH